MSKSGRPCLVLMFYSTQITFMSHDVHLKRVKNGDVGFQSVVLFKKHISNRRLRRS